MYDPETQAKVANWRAKAMNGTITPEEMVEVVKHLAAGRSSAAAASSSAKTTRKKAASVASLDGDDLLNEMLNLG